MSDSFDELDLVAEEPTTTPISSLELPDISYTASHENQNLKNNEELSKLVVQSVVKKRGTP